MAELSSAAQAVLDAVEDDCIHPDDKHRIAAAALRAAADQVVPQALCVYNPESISVRNQLLAIADELET
jgi:hypothetical protein